MEKSCKFVCVKVCLNPGNIFFTYWLSDFFSFFFQISFRRKTFSATCSRSRRRQQRALQQRRCSTELQSAPGSEVPLVLREIVQIYCFLLCRSRRRAVRTSCLWAVRICPKPPHRRFVESKEKLLKPETSTQITWDDSVPVFHSASLLCISSNISTNINTTLYYTILYSLIVPQQGHFKYSSI